MSLDERDLTVILIALDEYAQALERFIERMQDDGVDQKALDQSRSDVLRCQELTRRFTHTVPGR